LLALYKFNFVSCYTLYDNKGTLIISNLIILIDAKFEPELLKYIIKY